MITIPRVVSLLVWLVLLCSSASAFSQDRKTIRWLAWHQVPNFIMKGKFKGQGLGGTFTAALQRHLPQYDHKIIVSNTRRYNRLIREEDVCVAWAWIVPGSRDYRIHSRAVSLAPRTGIQTLKSKQARFGKPGETLSLARLLADDSIRLGYLEEMTYTKRVHDLIDRYRGRDNIFFSSAKEVEFNLELLDRGRVDYLFGFSAQAIFDARLKDIPNKYQFYNIEEIDKYTSMHTHCSNSEFGREVMDDLNGIITDKLLLEHLAVVERWYGDNADYRAVFMDYVVNQRPSSRVTHPGQ